MAQWIEYPAKPRTRVWILRIHATKTGLGMVACMCNPRRPTAEMEGRGRRMPGISKNSHPDLGSEQRFPSQTWWKARTRYQGLSFGLHAHIVAHECPYSLEYTPICIHI